MNTNIIKHEGEVNLVGVKVPCYVLKNGIRILSIQGMREVLKKIGAGYSKQKSDWYEQYLSKESQILPVYEKEKEENLDPVIGFEATKLEDLLNFYLGETKSNVKLSPKRKLIVKQHEMLLRSFAKTGIIALIDEATGYQYERERIELQKALEKNIALVKLSSLISKVPENKEEFIKHLKEQYYSDDDISKSDFDKVLKILLNTPPQKK